MNTIRGTIPAKLLALEPNGDIVIYSPDNLGTEVARIPLVDLAQLLNDLIIEREASRSALRWCGINQTHHGRRAVVIRETYAQVGRISDPPISRQRIEGVIDWPPTAARPRLRNGDRVDTFAADAPVTLIDTP